MAKNPAPVFNTGGGGFIFEGKVAAIYLAALLCDTAGPGTDAATVIGVRQQQTAFGDPLDDVIVDIESAGRQGVLSLQVKTTLELNANPSNDNLRAIVRDSLATLQTPGFQDGLSRFGAVTANIKPAYFTALETIVQWAVASADSGYFASRFASASKRQGEIHRVFETLLAETLNASCPPELLHRFFMHFIVLQFDQYDRSSGIAAVRQIAANAAAGPVIWSELENIARAGAAVAQQASRPWLLTRLRYLPVKPELKTAADPFNGLPLVDPSEDFGDGKNATGFDSLNFRARFDDWLGRTGDLDHLDAFLTADAPFLWQLVHGDGGMGKSRLALHWLHHLPAPWVGGFLRLAEASAADPLAWRPAADTVIVVDYAATDVKRLGELIAAWRRTAGRWRIRLLLLERNANADWLDRLSKQVTRLDALRFAEPWGLLPLDDDDLLALIKTRLDRREKTPPPEAALLKTLTRVDPRKRPLFAGVLAEALADGQPLEAIQRDTLLTEALDRERYRFWLTADERDIYDRNGYLPEDLWRTSNLMALATMTKGLSQDQCRELMKSDDLKSILPDLSPTVVARLKRMAGVSTGDTSWPRPIEPDLLGELFVLRHLACEDQPDDSSYQLPQHLRQALVDAAWIIAPVAMQDFLVRAGHDYFERIQALNFLQPDATLDNIRWRFADAQVGLIRGRLPMTFERAIHDRVRTLQIAYGGDTLLREHTASGAYNLARHEGEEGNLANARTLFSWPKSLQVAYPDDVAVCNIASKTANNLMIDEGKAGNLIEMRNLFSWLRNLHLSYPDDDAIREQGAIGALNLIYGIIILEGTREEAVSMWRYAEARASGTTYDYLFEGLIRIRHVLTDRGWLDS